MRIRLDDAMGLGGGAGDVARELRRGDARRHRGEEFRLGIAVLDLKPVPVDRSAVEPGWRSGLEPPEREPGAVEALGERDRGRIAETPGRRTLVAEMNDSAQEGAGGEHDCAAGDRAAVGELDAGYAVGIGGDPSRLPFDDGQVRSFGDERLHGAPIELPVGLGARPLDGGSLAAVEDAELNAGGIGGARHHAVERVDLAHQMALAQAADRRIAGHLADRCEAVGDQRGSRAAARRRGRGFASRMAPADDNDVKFHRRPPVSRETRTADVVMAGCPGHPRPRGAASGIEGRSRRLCLRGDHVGPDAPAARRGWPMTSSDHDASRGHVQHATMLDPTSQRTGAQRSLRARLQRQSARLCDPSPRPRAEDPRRSIPAPPPPARAPKPAPGARPETRAGAFQASTKPARAKTCALRPDRQ